MARLVLVCTALIGLVGVLSCGDKQATMNDAVPGDSAGIETGDSSDGFPAVNVATSCDEGEPLALVHSLSQGDGGIKGIGRLWRMAVTPDGKHLYGGSVASNSYNDPVKPSDMIAIFERDLQTGKVDWKGVSEGLLGMPGIYPTSARSVIASPDGEFIYVQWDEGHLTSLKRDEESGMLDFFQSLETGRLLNEMVVWPDGSLLVGATSNDGGEEDQLLVYQRDSGTDKLVLGQQIPLAINIVCPVDHHVWNTLVVAPDGKHLYVLAERQTLLIFELDLESGEFALTSQLPFSGAEKSCPWRGEQDLAISPDGHHLYLLFVDRYANFDYDARVTLYYRNSDSGSLVKGESHEWPETEHYGWLTTGMLRVSPDGASVYVDYGGAVLANYARDIDTGSLQFVDQIGAENYFVLSPDGDNLYIASYFQDVLWNQLRAFSRDQETGSLTGIQEVAEGQGGLQGLVSPSSVDFSPDGHFAYVGSSQALSWFERSGEEGSGLSPAGSYEDSAEDGYVLGYGPDVKVSPDGKYIYVAGGSGCPTIFARDPETGGASLHSAGGCNSQSQGCDEFGCSAGSPSSLAFSPDGKNLYGVTQGGDEETFSPVFTVYGVDQENGSLEVVQADWWQQCDEDETDDDYGGMCLVTPDQALVSPDGRNVYVSWPGLSKIQFFTRDTSTGALTEAGSVKEGEGGVPVDSMYGELAMSQDGNHLYTAGNWGVTLFARDQVTGLLAYVETAELKPVSRDDGWLSAYALSIVPPGNRLLALTEYGVTIYDRDPDTGELQLAKHMTVWEEPGNYGLHMSLVPSSDQLFITRHSWDNLTVLELCTPDSP